MDSGASTTDNVEPKSAEERVKARLEAMESSSSDVEKSSEIAEVDLPTGDSTITPIEESSKEVSSDAVVEGALNSSGKGEVSASTIARMMGVATTNELSMLEGKIDLLSSRVNNITAKLERLNGTLSRMPTGTDLDRIDINIGSLRTLIKESLELLTTAAEKEKATGDEGTLNKATIMSSSDSESDE